MLTPGVIEGICPGMKVSNDGDGDVSEDVPDAAAVAMAAA